MISISGSSALKLDSKIDTSTASKSTGADVYVKSSGLIKLPRLTQYEDPTHFFSIDNHLRPLFEEIRAHNASDIYIQHGKPICVLKSNKLYAVTWRILTDAEVDWFLTTVAGSTAMGSIRDQKAINTSYGLFDKDEKKRNLSGSRMQHKYRVNAVGTMTTGSLSFQIVMRTIPADPPHFSEIGLKESFVRKCCPNRGIYLVAGVTGSGKSTTLASTVRYILQNETDIQGNIITHEEPIEFTYDNIESRHSIIVQSQIPENYATFHSATREAMRRKPALILLGELRDDESISSAIEDALTGHPVFGTVHANSVAEVIPRLISRFDPRQAHSALQDIIQCSTGFMAQRLIPKADGKLMAVREYVFLSRKLKEELMSFTDHQEVNKFMFTLLEERGSFDDDALISPPFSAQGMALLEQKIIDENGLRKLIEFGE